MALNNNCRAQSISPGDTTFCQVGRVLLTATPAGTTYIWRQNGLIIPGATSRTYTATAIGSYDVIVTTAGTPVTYPAVVVTVNPKPGANFTFVQPSVCSKDAVSFTSSLTGTGLTYSWDFGDPYSGSFNSSNDPNPIHRFIGVNGGGPQSFLVKLTVTNNFGCDSSIFKTISFKQPSSRLGGTFIDCIGSSPVTLTFVNQSTTQPNSNYEIIWGTVLSPYTFNSPTFNTPITHSYPTGDTTLKFIVTGANGCIDTSIYQIFVGTNPKGSLDGPGNTRGCTGATFSFPFSKSVEENIKGTVYIIWVNDSSPIKYDTFYNPPPLAYTHTFNKSNCAPGMPNSFTVSYLFTNPCAGVGTPGSTGGIQISDRPKADFTISPNDTVCINSPVTLTTPILNSLGQNGSCSPTKVVWKIAGTQGVDWVLNSGSLGDDFNVNIPSVWIGGTNTVSITFKTTRKFDVQLKTGGACGIDVITDTLTKTICADSIPTGSFVLAPGKDTGCAPLAVNMSTITNTPYCGNYRYRWTVTYTNPMSCLPAGRNFRYINNTDSTTREPSIEFINPGVYTLGLVVINPGGTCSSTMFTKQITVKGKPNVSLTTSTIPSAICVNQCITPRATYNCYINANTIFSWSFPGSVQNTSAAQNPGSICYETPGTYTISLKVTNDCGDTLITRQITVNPAPTISSSSLNPTGCGTPTGSIILNGLLPNITYSVSYTRGGTLTTSSLPSSNNGTITIPGLPAGNYTNISVSLGGCVSNIIAFIILTDPNGPATPSARSNALICAGDTLKLFTDTILGATYSWTGPFSSTAQNPFWPNASSSMNGTYFVTIKLNGCTSAPGSVNVAIRAKPAKPVVCASSIAAHCFNDATSPLCAIASAQNTLFWCTNFPQGCSINAPVPRTDIVGSICYAVYQQSDTSGCKSDTVMICVTVVPKIVSNAIRGDQTLCDAGAVPSPLVQASGNVSGGTGSYTYKWEQSTDGGTAWVAVGTNPSYSPGSLTVTAKYRRIVSSGGCSDTSNIVTISRDGFGNNTIMAPQSICAGSIPLLLTGSSPSGGNGSFSYEWYDSTAGRPRRLVGLQQNYQPPSLDTTTFYIRKVSSTGCTGYASWIKITVFEKPVAGTITRDTTLCEGSSITIHSGLMRGVLKKWQYHPLPVTGSWLDSPETADSLIFRNVQNSFAVRLLVGSSGLGQGCDLSDTSNIVYITISQPSKGGETNTDDVVCSNSNAGVITLTNYTGQIIRWDTSKTRGASWGPVATTTSSFAYKDLTTTTWFRAVVKNNACTQAYSDTTIITVVNAVTTSNAGGDQTLCNVNSVMLSANRPSIGTGKWKQLSGPPASITDTTLYNTSLTGLLADNTYRLAWIITGNGQCSSSSDTVEIRISPLTTRANAGNDTSICDFTSLKTIDLHANQPRSNEIGQWRVLSGTSGSLNNPSNPNSTLTFSQPGIYKLVWRISDGSAGSCPANEDTLNVNVYEKPVVGAITPSATSICAGDSIFLSINQSNGAVLKWQYNLTPSNAGTWLDVNNNVSSITFRNVLNAFSVRVLAVVPGSTGCTVADTSKPVFVNVTAAPAISIKVLPFLVLEQPDYTFNFIETSSSNVNRRYLWSMGDRSLQTRSGKEISYTYPDTGIYKVKLLITDLLTDCKASDSVTVKIRHIPGYLYIPNAMCVGCSNNSLRQLLPLGKGLKFYRLRIFTKWGKLLFETTSLNPDGSPNEPWRADFSNNMMLQQDAFMWVAEAKFVNNTEWKGMVYPDDPHKYLKTGFITVIK